VDPGFRRRGARVAGWCRGSRGALVVGLPGSGVGRSFGIAGVGVLGGGVGGPGVAWFGGVWRVLGRGVVVGAVFGGGVGPARWRLGWWFCWGVVGVGVGWSLGFGVLGVWGVFGGFEVVAKVPARPLPASRVLLPPRSTSFRLRPFLVGAFPPSLQRHAEFAKKSLCFGNATIQGTGIVHVFLPFKIPV